MKILLPFYDDSTLLFAAKMKEQLSLAGSSCSTYYMAHTRDAADISERQMKINLEKGPDILADERVISADSVAGYDAVIVCKVTKELRALVDESKYMAGNNRPCFIAFQPGLEFTPEKGIHNRRNFDVLFLNNQDDVDKHGASVGGQRRTQVGWGHPYFMKPTRLLDDAGGEIYFFAQAISPKSYNGRLHVAEVLKAIALANPERKLVVKLRHLPTENTVHVHKEEYNYPDLFEDLWDVPDNIEFSACSMKEALSRASIAITCTSTAAMDSISAGIPTIVYVDYVENYKDRMATQMRRIFSESGLVLPLKSVLYLDSVKPKKSWLERHFRDHTLFEELQNTVSAFQNSAIVGR